MRPSNEYLGVMMEIVEKTYSLANSQALEANESFLKATDWSEVLYKIIPLDRLRECYDRAVADHDTTFAVNAHDLKNAWKKIRDEDLHRRHMARLEAAKRTPAAHEPVCLRCRDTNCETVYLLTGEKLGTRNYCHHEPLREGEWLYGEEQRLEALGRQLAEQARRGEARIIDLPKETGFLRRLK